MTGLIILISLFAIDTVLVAFILYPVQAQEVLLTKQQLAALEIPALIITIKQQLAALEIAAVTFCRLG